LPAAVSAHRNLHVQVLVVFLCGLGTPGPGLQRGGPASPVLVGGLVSPVAASALRHLLLLVLMGVCVSLGLSAPAFIAADSAPLLSRAGGRVGLAGGAVQLPGLPIWPRHVSAPALIAANLFPEPAAATYAPSASVCAAAHGCLFGLGRSRPRLTSRRALLPRSCGRAYPTFGGPGPSTPVYADARVVCLVSAHPGLAPHRGGLCPSVLAGKPVLPAAATALRHLLVQLPGWFIWPRRASASALIAVGPAPPFWRTGQSSQRRLPRPYPFYGHLLTRVDLLRSTSSGPPSSAPFWRSWRRAVLRRSRTILPSSTSSRRPPKGNLQILWDLPPRDCLPAQVAGSVFAPSPSRWCRGSDDTDLGPAAYPQPFHPITSRVRERT